MKPVPIVVLSILLTLGGMSARGRACAQSLTDKAKVIDAFGPAKRRAGDRAAWQSINVDDLLPAQTTVQTGENAAVLLLLPDRHVFRIGASTTVQLKQLGKYKEFSFSVLSGHVWSFVRSAAKPAKYEIETPSAVAGVSGTVFSVSHDPDTSETEVTTDTGAVRVNSGGRAQMVSSGFAISARRGTLLGTPAVQNEGQRRAWRFLRAGETWMRGGAAGGRLNPRVESALRIVRKPRRPGGALAPRRPGRQPGPARRPLRPARRRRRDR